METRPVKTRFAPSPTGLLHLGNVRTALFNYLLARRAGGTFLLRLEDTDAMRGHEKYAAAILDDLRWLGLAWDEGPEAGGPNGPYAQSQRGGIYRKYYSILEERGLAYPCFCSEHELAIARKTEIAAGRPPRYSGRCRALSRDETEARFAKGAPATLRFHVADGRAVEFEDEVRGPQLFRTDDIGDYVIRRSDGTPAFFFCNAVDDALMGVTLVVRGEDHLTNTPRQILLLQALDFPVPAYAHIALVVGADGAPLSKRAGSQSVQDLRAAGYLPQALVNHLARLGHTFDETGFLDLAGLARGFTAARLHRAPARFDERQLLHWQHEAVRYAAPDALWEWMGEEAHRRVPDDRRDAFIECVRGNILFPPDAARWAGLLFGDSLRHSRPAREVIRDAGSGFFEHALSAVRRLRLPDFKEMAADIEKTTGKKGKALFQPLRVALTGELDGPEMVKLLPLMGLERARARLQKAGEIAEASSK
jgi:glutamyl-tRNA synthetase